jgi:hypothetical protein
VAVDWKRTKQHSSKTARIVEAIRLKRGVAGASSLVVLSHRHALGEAARAVRLAASAFLVMRNHSHLAL